MTDPKARGGLRAAAVAALNDTFRARPGDGWYVTSGVRSLGVPVLARLVAAVRGYDHFSEDDDPHGEHDFGAFEIDGARFFWKIDYYDRDLSAGSPDPADPALTRRILTVMRAEEY